MRRLALDFDPYANEPAHWGASLLNDAEMLIACLDAAQAKSVVEVGAYAGDLTGLLLDWAATSGARVWAIDPSPQKELVALDESRADLELVRATSHEALKTIPLPDAAIIDGDHNYFTVSEELRIIGERAQGATLPLLLFHDVCWPHGRRDDYFAPGPDPRRAPPADDRGRQPVPRRARGARGWAALPWPAAREGGPRNGVLTAVEDFVEGHGGLRLAIVPAFFGLGVVWDTDAPWADDMADTLEPWDRNPLLERLEANRVLHLTSTLNANYRAGRQEAVLRRLLESRAFALAERLSRLRHRVGIATDTSVVSRKDVRRALGDEP